jgi:hypothetical protein
MDATATQFIIKEMFNAFDNAQKEVYQILWDNLLSFLSSNWLSVAGFLLLLLVISFIVALFGRWGMFGSVLYNYLYCGTLFIFGLIFGPKIFANLFIDIALFILYLACYKLVGRILTGLHLKK